jgi:hypothetical protein
MCRSSAPITTHNSGCSTQQTSRLRCTRKYRLSRAGILLVSLRVCVCVCVCVCDRVRVLIHTCDNMHTSANMCTSRQSSHLSSIP